MTRRFYGVSASFRIPNSSRIGQTGKTGLATLTETIGWCQEKCGNFIGLRGHFYIRIDAPATPEQKAVFKRFSPEMMTAKELAGEPIIAALTRAPGNDADIGGLKVVVKSGWFAARPSGTEDIYKVYAESFRSEGHLQRIVKDAVTIISGAFEAAGKKNII